MPVKTKAELEAEMEAMKQKMEAEMARMQAEREATRREVEQLQTAQEQEVLDLKARLTAAEAIKEDPAKSEPGAIQPWFQQYMQAQREEARAVRQQLAAQQNNMEALIRGMTEQRARTTSSSSSEPDTDPVSNIKPSAPQKLAADISVPKFKAWRASWEDYAKLCNVNSMKLDRQQSLLRSLMSLDMRKVLEKVIQVSDKDCPAEILQKIETHLRKKRNVVVDTRDLEERKQREGETFQEYLITVTDLAEEADVTADHCDDCQKTCLDRRLASRIISGIRDGETRRKLLALSPFPTLDKVKEICSAEESAQNDDVKMGKRATEVNRTIAGEEQKYPRKKGNRRQQQGGGQGQQGGQQGEKANKCGRCGRNAHQKDQVCPAKEATCNFCEKKGHFESVCRTKNQPPPKYPGSKKTNRVIVKRVAGCERSPHVTVEVMSKGKELGQFKATPDTGADVCLAGTNLLNSSGISKKELLPASEKLSGIEGKLRCLGKLPVTIRNGCNEVKTEVHICPAARQLLLSYEACRELGYIPDNFPEVIDKSAEVRVTTSQRLVLPRPRSREWKLSETATKEEIQEIKSKLVAKYPDVFFSGGELPPMQGEPMVIELTEDAVPFKVTTARQLPFAAREDIKKQLDDMVVQKVIAAETKPTKWVHPLVVIMKPDGTWRLCVDLTKLNKFVRRPYYPMVTSKEAVQNVPKGAKKFATLDAKAGYWQIPLAEQSQELTTFITPWGRFKFLRNPMGLASAQDEYCRRGDEALQGVQHYCKVVDDILVHGETNQDLLNTVIDVLDRCRAHKITLNPKKFQFCQEELEYVGYRIGKEGIKADTHKLEAIEKFPEPTQLVELRSFMGLVNQFTDFTPHIAQAAEPLRGLMKPKNAFVWSQDHSAAFSAVKQALIKPPVLAPFDPKAPTMLQTDASRLKGLGYALMQKQEGKWRLIQCGSRFLSPAESRYAMIELELLAVVWAVTEKCWLYLKGLPFELVIDHKPLIPILNSYTLDMIENPRLQRLKLKLMWYNLRATWKKGADHVIPDALSRAPVADPTPADQIGEFDSAFSSQILRVTAQITDITGEQKEALPDLYLERIKKAAGEDSEYKSLMQYLMEESPKEMPAAVRPFTKVLQQLTVHDGLVLKGYQIVIPKALRRDVLADLHLSHQGIDRTKRRARQTVYWPGINADIQSTVEACEPCQIRLPSQQKESMQRDPATTRPFEDTSADLFTSGNHKYLVYVDRFSGWPTVHAWKHDPSTAQVVNALTTDFCTYGTPLRMRTDGGPQFASAAFQEFLAEWNVATGYSTPHYPQSNGHAEAAVKAMKALVVKTECKGNLTSPSFAAGLLEWRNTPKEHGCSPAQLLYGRSTRTKTPAVALFGPSETSGHQDKKRQIQDEAKGRYDAHASDLKPLSPGQKVRIQDPTTKLWDKTGTIARAGQHRAYKIELCNGKMYWRNRKFIRLFHEPKDASSPTRKSPGGRERKDSSTSTSHEPRRSTRARRRPDRFGQ